MSSAPVLKGSSFTFSILQLSNSDIQQALEYLQAKVAQAPNFFQFAPLVINIEQVTDEVDYAELKHGIERLQMRPVGVAGWRTDDDKARIFAAGLAALQVGASNRAAMSTSAPASDKAQTHPPTISDASTQPAVHQPALVIRTPVRSGQQVYAKDRDLVILGSVSNGAEVISDGSIQVYGTLRGRAIAGATGHPEAYIMCHNLQAELCSIAGSYWLSDQIEERFWQQAVAIRKQDDSLEIDPLTF